MDSTDSGREYQINDNEFLVLVSDKAGNFIYANPAYLAASGYSWNELKGTMTAKMLHKDTPPQVSVDMVNSIIGKKPWTGIIKNKRKNGDHYWLRLNISPLFSNGEYAGALLVHSKADPEELRRMQPLYREMSQNPKGKLQLWNGAPIRMNLLGKLRVKTAKYGLNNLIWGGMGLLNLLALGCLISVTTSFGLGFWLALTMFAAASGLLGAHMSSTVVQPLREAVAYANSVAAGDLSKQIINPRSDEIGSLIRALGQMTMNMRATVVDVREGVDLMRQATSHIARGTQDLSKRTEHQTGHLQTTAALIEQVTAAAEQTANASQEASQYAGAASQTAVTGGKVITDVETTMQAITESSKRISDIIGVIDSIAFQTNILALNAAVEAARAGEHGRGFGVVAAEVRSLAQRSAQSAQEIRNLILESVKKVDGGASLVSSAGTSMRDLEAQVRQVTELVRSIADRAGGQSRDINQINNGVMELEQVTEINAGMVAEHTAAAGQLKEQAARLAEAVSVFKLTQQETQALFSSVKATAEDARKAALNRAA